MDKCIYTAVIAWLDIFIVFIWTNCLKLSLKILSTTMLTVGLWFYVIMMGLLLLFAIFSNALVVYCVIRKKKLRSVTNVFICNLSISDILLAGFVMPQKLHDISHTDGFYEGTLLKFKIKQTSQILFLKYSFFNTSFAFLFKNTD